jgi:hypothetical protein
MPKNTSKKNEEKLKIFLAKQNNDTKTNIIKARTNSTKPSAN